MMPLDAGGEELCSGKICLYTLFTHPKQDTSENLFNVFAKEELGGGVGGEDSLRCIARFVEGLQWTFHSAVSPNALLSWKDRNDHLPPTEGN